MRPPEEIVMRRPVPPARRSRKNKCKPAVIAGHRVRGGAFGCGARLHPSTSITDPHSQVGRRGSDTVADGPGADWALREISSETSSGISSKICSIVRWALADLAVALLEIERQLALSSEETQSAGGSRRFAARN